MAEETIQNAPTLSEPTDEAPTEEQKQEPKPEPDNSEFEHKPDQSTVPEKPDGYTVPYETANAEDFDQDLLDGFQKVAHCLDMTDGKFSEALHWWGEYAKTYEGDRDKLIADFSKDGREMGFGDKELGVLAKWFKKLTSADDARLKKVKKSSNHTPATAQAISRLSASKAYKDKRNPQHKKAVKEMIKLCSQR